MSAEGKSLPAIPAKRYFTIGEVSELCGVKAYVLRYWEQEFTQLKPMKRRGNRRYYQHHEVLLIRRIRDLLYEQGFTISGARNQLTDAMAAPPAVSSGAPDEGVEASDAAASTPASRRDPAARTRASDRGVQRTAAAASSSADALAVDLLAARDDDPALEAELAARAREDEALIERARREAGEAADQVDDDAPPSAATQPAPAPASRAGVRSAALLARGPAGRSATAPRAADLDTEQLRAELLAIRALLIS